MGAGVLKSPIHWGRLLLYFSILLVLPSITSARSLGLSLASGVGCHNIFPIRVGFQKAFDHQFRTHCSWPISGYWEASGYAMHGSRRRWPNCNHHLYAIALAGVFRVERKEALNGVWPYIDVGIGLSLITKREMCGRDMGIRFQFEDRFGLGLRFGEVRQYELGYRVIHFSNAYLARKNASINLHLLVLGYWF